MYQVGKLGRTGPDVMRRELTMNNWSGIGLMVIDLMQAVRRGRAGRKKVGQITGYQLGVFLNECTTGEAQNLYLL